MRIIRFALVVAASVGLAACAVSPDPNSLTFDPFASSNRSVHAVNVQIDRSVYGPVARGYGRVTPQPFRQGVSNLRNNWRLPAHVLQYALQGRPVLAGQSTARFAVNTVAGIGGLFDPARRINLPYRETGADETLYRWGAPEGGYLELPFVGPGTQRDWGSYVLDFALDPLTYVLPAAATTAIFGVGAVDLVGERYEFDPVIEALLHESADSYTAQRISYLQNARARLQGETELDQLEDVYADF